MRTDRRGIQFLLREREAALQSGKPVLEVGELLARHQVDSGELLQALEPLVAHELAFALVLVHTQTRFGMHGEICRQIRLLEVRESALRLLAESCSTPLRRVANLRENLVPRRLHLVDPLMAGGQNRLGSGEVRGRGPEVDSPVPQAI